ncbi:GSCFA family protein [Mesonia algae]|uniref:GSCFA family protein n=1 Tax=Mesonia algae TaxID=213248 RepID=A0A2W7K1P2_9FLAO|nr:GSCFA domain-containing protein [Mesonia algae]PZW41530.1 GSCFA family protein [Mesonia algae]
MQFQTKIPIQEQEPKIDYTSKLVLLGSCFSENIGEKFTYFKFRQLQNPFGILFHPFAIENLVDKAVNQFVYTEKNLVFHNEQWHCFDAHSRLSSPDKIQLLETLNEALQQTYKELKEASHIIITYGTAWVYQLKDPQKFVANCHKIPQREFDKKLILAEKLQENIQNTIELIQQINPSAAFIFTVSPVRHIKDGFVENQQSKSALITAVHQSITSVKKASYFPSYEIMMDELRDYRFYAQDMLHPSDLAIDYIWQRFVETRLTQSTQQMMQEIDKIQKGMLHKAFNQESEAHQKFLIKLELSKKTLIEKFPFINF